MQQNIKLAVPFFIVKNIEASLHFYCDKLGFQLTKQWEPRGKIEWCWLERDAVSVMLQEPRKLNADQSGALGIGITICYQCADALSLYREFLDKKLTINEPFVGNGMWVVGLKDPNGYRLEFASITDLPEESTYFSIFGNDDK